jgi:hypothetical protein
MDNPSHGRLLCSRVDQAASGPALQSAVGWDCPKTAGKNGRRKVVVVTICPE